MQKIKKIKLKIKIKLKVNYVHKYFKHKNNLYIKLFNSFTFKFLYLSQIKMLFNMNCKVFNMNC